VLFIRGGTARRAFEHRARRSHLHEVEAARVAIPESAPTFEVFYDIEAVWAPESLERARRSGRRAIRHDAPE
jgi:hypothetical protein